MQPVRRAVIDVGTNSVKLLVADVAGRQVEPVCEQSKQTRLGHGFYETRQLQSGAIAATAKAVADFAALARQAHAVSFRVIATSAAREAVNRDELTAAIEQASGLKVDTLTDAVGSQTMPMGGAGAGFGGTAPRPPADPTPWLLTIAAGSLLAAAGLAWLRRPRRAAV